MPERVVEEGAERVGPPVGDATVGFAGFTVVARGLRGARPSRNAISSHELRVGQVPLQIAKLVDRRGRAVSVGVLDEPANGDVSHAVGRETARNLLHVLPAAIGVAAVDAQDGEAVGRLGLVLVRIVGCDGLEPACRLGDVPGAGRGLGGGPAGLVAWRRPFVATDAALS